MQLSPDGHVGVVMASMGVSSTDMKAAHGLFDRGTEMIASLDPASFHPEMKAEVVGAFRDFLEVRKLMSDSQMATAISMVVLVILLVMSFRSMRAIAVVIVPLIMGLGWSLFLIASLFEELNVLSLFVFAMLIGMGIDYSIHIYQRALDEFHARGGVGMRRCFWRSLGRAAR